MEFIGKGIERPMKCLCCGKKIIHWIKLSATLQHNAVPKGIISRQVPLYMCPSCGNIHGGIDAIEHLGEVKGGWFEE